DRLTRTQFPNTTKGSGTSNPNDDELRVYDANGNVISFTNRAKQTTSFTFDKLNRLTLKNLVAGELDVTYSYDSRGRLTSASQTGNSLSFTYDALNRNL